MNQIIEAYRCEKVRDYENNTSELNILHLFIQELLLLISRFVKVVFIIQIAWLDIWINPTLEAKFLLFKNNLCSSGD